METSPECRNNPTDKSSHENLSNPQYESKRQNHPAETLRLSHQGCSPYCHNLNKINFLFGSVLFLIFETISWVRGHSGGTLKLCLLTAGGPTNCKQCFLLRGILGLYFLYRSQTFTCLPPPNAVIFHLKGGPSWTASVWGSDWWFR